MFLCPDRTITKEELLTFYREYLSHKSKKRKKLGSHVLSMAEGGAGNAGNAVVIDAKSPESKKTGDEEEDLLPVPVIDVVPVKVEDPTLFKGSLPLYPTQSPFVDPKTFVKARP